MSDTVVSRRQKNVQLYWLKRFKIVPKKHNLDQKINYSKSQGQQKLAKRSLILQYSFAQKTLLNSAQPQLTRHYKIYISATQPQTAIKLTLMSEKTFALHAKELYFRSSWKANIFVPL